MAMSPSGLFEMNDTHIEEFYRDGYFVAPRLIDRETVESIIDDFESQGETVDPAGEWKATGFTHFSSHAETYPRVAQFLQSERLVDMMERLFRSPARLWLGMYAVVRPQGGRGLAWHQDNQYTHILGPALNAFIALDTITEENAGLWIAPRSHLLGRQPNINEGEGHPVTRYFFTGRPYIGAVRTARKMCDEPLHFRWLATRATMPRAESRL
jgi:hypothetical protein